MLVYASEKEESMVDGTRVKVETGRKCHLPCLGPESMRKALRKLGKGAAKN